MSTLTLRLLAVAALTLGLCARAEASELQAVRVIEADGATRAVVELDAAPDYRLFALAGPDRLVLDVAGGRLGGRFRAPTPGGIVAGVRTGQPSAEQLRVVFDLVGGVRPRSWVERSGNRHHLVIELRPDGATATASAASAAPAPVRTVEQVVGDGQRDLVIAIDAGHGGHDPGARGARGSWEKHITLAMARELARQINAEPGLRAVMIRDSDVFIPLERRYQLAREAQADLFISIHADAFHRPTASGSSVFVLSQRGASSEAARWLADQENSADLVGGVSLDDRDDTLAAVLLDLSQSATMRASEDAATHVLAALKSVGKTHKHDVERANFVVLRSPDVPSMLVETAFISNPEEEARLNDPDYRRRMSTAIVGGIRTFFAAAPPPGTWYAANAERIPRGNREHVVGRGETLSLIAARHGIPLARLRSANNLRGDMVRIGQRLVIPGNG